tara:strand:- start:447 stop:1013 length:567 start_codon:yes stop_codon:yes gene_type:complete
VTRKKDDDEEKEDNLDDVILMSPEHLRDTWTSIAALSATFDLPAKSTLLDSTSLSSGCFEYVATPHKMEEDRVSNPHPLSALQWTTIGVAYLVPVWVLVLVLVLALVVVVNLAATCCWNPSWHLRYAMLLTLILSLMYFSNESLVRIDALMQVTKEIDVMPFMTVHTALSFALVAHVTFKSDSFEGWT